jgi:MFS family permease
MNSNVRPPLWTKDFIITTFANLFLFISFQMLIPTLPPYVEQMGGDNFIVGLIVGIFTLFALLVRPLAGRATNDFGRKPVLIAGLILFALSVSGYYWMSTFFLVLLLRIPHGIGWGMTTTSLGTIVSDIVPPQRRGEGMGFYGLSSTLAMALSPLFGIWLMNELGFGYVFFISTLLAIISILLSLFIKEHMPKELLNPTKKESFLQSIIEKKALLPTLLALLLGFTYSGIVTFITLFGVEKDLSNVGWFFFANAGMVMIIRPLAGKLFDQKGHQWVLLPGAISAICGLILLSFTANMIGLVSAAIFYGIGFGMIQPALQAWVINRVPPHKRGVATGTFFSGFDLGIGLGAITLGLLARFTGYSLMYRLSSLLIVIFLVVYISYLVRSKKAA